MQTMSYRIGAALVLAFACVVPRHSLAASAAAEVNLQSFGMGDGGEGMYIWPKVVPATALACPNARFFMPIATPSFDVNVSILMSAAAQRLPVSLVYDGAACASGNWKVIAIRMNVP